MNKAKEYYEQIVRAFPEASFNQGYSWILQNGREFKARNLNKEIKEKLKEVKHFQARMRQCYYNAQRLTEYSNNLFKYYEGVATSKKVGIPFEHGFNVYKGIVVDTTWKDGNEYFGVEIPLAFIRKHWAETGIAESLIGEFYYRTVVKKAE